mmetsp:Transcript_16095/g.26784  ORF Transcript_16095/g.26784 Transcript_16095/m.26784 type:complete len:263 (+) Transcript_16095:1195-1983(+)
MGEPHRIFRTPLLHALQVRYPWAGGYLVAPLAFQVARSQKWAVLSRVAKPLILMRAEPLSGVTLWIHGQLTSAAFTLHFVRRLAEVLFLQDYTGSFSRDSRFELLYYALWGILAGSSVAHRSLVPSKTYWSAGLTLFLAGQAGNAWCHLELRRLRAAKDALGQSRNSTEGRAATGYYEIPSRGPFAYITCPHYTFELLTWIGYAVHSGFDPSSCVLIALSVLAMAPFAVERHAKYALMYRKRVDGTVSLDPARKWKMVPGIW